MTEIKGSAQVPQQHPKPKDTAPRKDAPVLRDEENDGWGTTGVGNGGGYGIQKDSSSDGLFTDKVDIKFPKK